jgi:hypothetical protein
MTTQIKAINCKTAPFSELKKAFLTGQPIEGIDALVSHHGAHNDEIFGGFALQTTLQGKTLFPGIEKATFGAVSTTFLRNNNWLGEAGFFKAMQQGNLLLGVGGGLLDEHSDRDRHISCTERVVKLLDLKRTAYDRKVYGNLIRYINHEDGYGDNIMTLVNNMPLSRKLEKEESDTVLKLQIGCFAQNLKKGFEAAGEDTEAQVAVFAMAYQFYHNEISQSKLYVEAESKYDAIRKTAIEIVTSDKRNQSFLLEFESDIPCIHKVAQSKWKSRQDAKLAVLFLHKKNGQFVLMPNNRSLNVDDMREVVKIIRQTVARNACQDNPIDFESLGYTGIIDRVVEIHFDEATGIISNGSKVDPDVSGLLGKYLSVEEVINAIQTGLDTDYFPKKYAAGCAQGTCAERRCPLYHFGLKRCIDARSKNNTPIAAALKKANVVS